MSYLIRWADITHLVLWVQGRSPRVVRGPGKQNGTLEAFAINALPWSSWAKSD